MLHTPTPAVADAAPPAKPLEVIQMGAIKTEAVTVEPISATDQITIIPDAKPAPPAAPPARPAPPPTTGTTTGTGTVFSPEQLPPAVRAQLPTLEIAGLSYSSNPAHRMVIVNGQVLHEGDQAAPGLLLQGIEPQRTLWSFQGYRYALPGQVSQ